MQHSKVSIQHTVCIKKQMSDTFFHFKFFLLLLNLTICMPKAGFLVARFKWLNYIPDWPAPRIL